MRRTQFIIRALLAAFFCAAAVSASDAHASPISVVGTPTSGFNSNVPAAPLNANNYLEFFIPISQAASGTLGVNNVGLVSDYGSGGGSVFVYFNFGIIADALDTVSLVIDMIDVDFDRGANDINEMQGGSWREQVRFFGLNGYSTAVIDNLDDSTAGLFTITGNYDSQQIVFSDISGFFTPSSNAPFVLGMEFTSSITPFLEGWNTSEFVRATLSANTVPEPTSMLLLGTGAAAAAWRRRKRAA